MGSRETRTDDRDRDPEIEKYQQAALDALGQLEWVVGYLHQSHKSDIARALDRNRKQTWST